MTRAWCSADAPLDVAIRPPCAERAKAVTARSISTASRTSIGLTSTLRGSATAWITPNWAIAAEFVGSRRTATRVTSGAISLSSSSHFPPMLYSEIMKPVVLPPGRARLPDDAGADWIADDRKDDRHAAGRLL